MCCIRTLKFEYFCVFSLFGICPRRRDVSHLLDQYAVLGTFPVHLDQSVFFLSSLPILQ